MGWGAVLVEDWRCGDKDTLLVLVLVVLLTEACSGEETVTGAYGSVLMSVS